MSGPSQEDIAEIVGSLQTGASDFARSAKQQSDMSRDEARRHLALGQRAKDFDKSLGNAVVSMGNWTKSFDHFMGHFTDKLKTFAGGAVLGAVIEAVHNNTQTFRELYNVGQTFQGSMLEMSRSAAQAGMPLDTFAKAVSKYSNVMAVMGTKRFFDLNMAMRKNLERQGMLGMSLEQLAEFQGSYLDTSRMLGTTQQANTKNFIALAKTTTALSAVTGVARERIAELANAAMRNTQAMAALYSMPTETRAAVEASMQQALAVYASIPGQTGEFLSSLMAEGVAGTSVYSDQGQALINVGLGDLTDQMNSLGNSVKNGTASIDDQVNMVAHFKNRIGDNMQSLQALALQGSAEAKQVIAMYGDLNSLSMHELQEKLRQQDKQKKFTNFMMALESIWGRLLGRLKEGFMGALEGWLDSMGDITKSERINKLGDMFHNLGKALGILVTKVLTPENVEKFSKFVGQITDWVTMIGTDLTDQSGLFMGVLNALATTGGVAISGLLTFANWMGKILNVLGPFAKYAIAAYLSLKVLGTVGGLFKGIVGLFKSNPLSSFGNMSEMTVNAGVVNINGDTGGIGGGGGGGGRKKRSRRSRLRDINARRAAQGRPPKGGFFTRMKGGLGGLFKGGGFLGKMGKAGKATPILGSLLGAAGLAYALSQGNMADAAANALTMIPGIGTGLAIGDMASSALGGPSMSGLLGGVFGGAGGAAASQAMSGLTGGAKTAEAAMTPAPSVDDPIILMKKMVAEGKETKDMMERLLASMIAIQKSTLNAIKKIEVNTQSL